MNYVKMIRDDVFKGIDDTLYMCLLQAGDRADVEADIMGMIIKQEIAQYTDDAVKRVKQAVKGGEPNDP